MNKKFNANSFKASVGIAKQQTQDRFEKADVVLGDVSSITKVAPKTEPAIQRQSLSVLKSEAELAESINQELRDLGFNPNISEIYRAGLKALSDLPFEQRKQLVLSLEHQINVSCFGQSSGGLDITVNGGIPAYSYSWSNSYTGEDVYGISSGNYSLTVTDFAGCSTSAAYTITQPASPLSVTTSVTGVICPNTSVATASATVAGGTPPYTYLWSTAQQLPSITNLTEGLYVVTVTDSNGCSFVTNVQVTEPDPFAVSDSIIPAKCFSSADGAVYITVTGATPGYNYVWSNSGVGQNLIGVTKGNYQVTITDLNGCSHSESYTVPSPPDLISSVAGNNPDCHGKATGFAIVSAGGGMPPYTYAWSTVPAQSGVMGVNLLGNVTYTVTITDGNSCTSTNSVLLTDPTPVVVSTVPDSVTCFNGNDGTVLIYASGGSAPYQYSLNNVYQPDSLLTGLAAGEYTAIAQDNNGCFGSQNFTISEPTSIFVDAGPDLVSVRGQTVTLNGTASSVNGITGYLWSPDNHLSCTACQSTNATPDTTFMYFLTATDGRNCSSYDSITVIVKNKVEYFIPTAFTPNADGLNDYFEVNILGANTIEVSVFDRWGERVYYNAAQHNGLLNNGDAWDGKKGGKAMPYDTYVYQLKVLFYNSTTEDKSGTITLVR